MLPDLAFPSLAYICFRLLDVTDQCPTEPGNNEQSPAFPSSRCGKRVPTFRVWPRALQPPRHYWPHLGSCPMGQGRQPAGSRPYAEVQRGFAEMLYPSCISLTPVLLSLSMPREVKSLPGIPPSPAPAIATFSQAPSQPQASQTLTPLAVQAAPQVRATSGSRTEGSGQEQAQGGHGLGNFVRQGRKEAALVA